MDVWLGFARSAWSQRHVLWELVRKDILGRFAGSLGGLLWTLIHPLAQIVIFYYLFSLIFRIRVPAEEVGTDSFLVFFLTGFVPWLCFSEAVSRSTGSVLDNAILVTKVLFPVELLPFSAVTAGFMVHLGAWVLLLSYLAFMGFGHVSWLLVVPATAVLYVFSMGLGLFLSALCVFMRDVREIVTIGLMVWFYATPILYPVGFVPDEIRWAVAANPMTTMVLMVRQILLHHRVPSEGLWWASIWAVVVYVLGAAFFGRCRRAFGDVL